MSTKTRNIIIILVIAVVGLIALECVIRMISSTTERVISKKEIEKQQEAYEQTIYYQEETKLNETIEKASDFIASGDYESLYSALDAEYKDYLGIVSADDYEEYLKSCFGEIDNIRFVDYISVGERYLCTIAVTVGETTRNYTILVEPNVDNDLGFDIILDNVLYINSYEDQYRKISSNIEYKLRHIVTRVDSVEYVFEITNNSTSTYSSTIKSIELKKTNGWSYYPNNLDEISELNIAPNETKKIVAVIEIPSTNYMWDKYIDITMQDSKGNEKLISITFGDDDYGL